DVCLAPCSLVEQRGKPSKRIDNGTEMCYSWKYEWLLYGNVHRWQVCRAERRMAEAPGVVTGDRACRTMQVRLDGDLYEWLRTKSLFERRSMNMLIVEALARTRASDVPHEVWRDRYPEH